MLKHDIRMQCLQLAVNRSRPSCTVQSLSSQGWPQTRVADISADALLSEAKLFAEWVETGAKCSPVKPTKKARSRR